MKTLLVPKETFEQETRVAATPETVKKLSELGFEVSLERLAGAAAHFPDADYANAGARLLNSVQEFDADIVLKVRAPSPSEISKFKKGTLLISLLDPFHPESPIQALAEAGVDCMAMELIPRTSRAQSMDALSSQAGISGYRAVIEAARHYHRFFPMMMTSAGSAKPAKMLVIGAGVAGLQAIATGRKLGATVEGYDIRPQVKEQIESLGARFVEIPVTEEGSGEGGYAKELSEESKKLQIQKLGERMSRYDIVISTANIPGKKAPILISEEAALSMKPGSVIVDMAVSNGGNCPLSECSKTVVKNGITFVGESNFPALMASDASHFYSRNLLALLKLMVKGEGSDRKFELNLEDDIIEATLVTRAGQIRFQRGN